MNSALVLFSGGQDSTTALCWAMERFEKVSAVSFDFGQRHIVELDSAKKIAEHLQIPQQVVDAKAAFAGITDCSLLLGKSETASAPSLPATFVPGRNLLFLTLAAIVAYPLGIRDLIIGVSQIDYSGYPDCREPFLQSAEQSISLALDEKFTIHAPFLHMTKADEIRLIQKLGKLELLADSHTCYRGERPSCGECDACLLRAAAFAEVGIADPLIESDSTEQIPGIR